MNAPSEWPLRTAYVERRTNETDIAVRVTIDGTGRTDLASGIAFLDHMLIPKRHVGSLYDVTDADAPALGRILLLAGRLAREQGAPDGFRTVINTGRVGRQDVKHVHVHVLGGPEPLGPMLPRA